MKFYKVIYNNLVVLVKVQTAIEADEDIHGNYHYYFAVVDTWHNTTRRVISVLFLKSIACQRDRTYEDRLITRYCCARCTVIPGPLALTTWLVGWFS